MSDRGHGDLDAKRLRALFGQLSAALETRGQTGQLFVVGGAAMALGYDSTRLTRDVDAVFVPARTVRELAAEVGARAGLDSDWINDAAKGFLPGQDDRARTVFESDALLVQVASAEYLLAMKLHASRDDRDLEDAVKLYKIAGYTTADEGIALLDRSYPEGQLLPRHRYVVAEVAARAHQSPATEVDSDQHATAGGRPMAERSEEPHGLRDRLRASYPTSAPDASRPPTDPQAIVRDRPRHHGRQMEL